MSVRDDFASPVPGADYESYKRRMYESLPARRRKFVDKIGYEAWEPFQKPKEPLDIRTDVTGRTTRDLVGQFLRETGGASPGNAFGQGVLDCAMGMVNNDEKFRGVFHFCLWYAELLQRENKDLP